MSASPHANPEKIPSGAGLPPLEPLEVASGMVFGRRRGPGGATGLPSPPPAVPEALEEILVPALSRPPCAVAFSGGRDSSIMLALATKVAREHGFPDPVPVTLRFEQHSRTREDEWQEAMIRHLDLDDWTRLSLHTEVEALGVIARGALRRHGLYWPANAHVLMPLMDAAKEGSLITGNGGDELFSRSSGTRIPFRHGLRIRPLRHAVLASVAFFLPFYPRVWLMHRGLLRLPWLAPSSRRRARRQFIESARPSAATWRESIQQFLDSRYLELGVGILSALAREADVLLVQPFLDPRFVAAAAAEAPEEGYPGREAAVDTLFGDLLPPATVRRRTKATFTEVLWGPETRSYAARPGALPLDPALVNHAALRRAWARPRPDFRTLTALQAAWLAEVRERDETPYETPVPT